MRSTRSSLWCVAVVGPAALWSVAAGQVQAPPELPASFAWNGHSAPFWGYARGGILGTLEDESNFQEFMVTQAPPVRVRRPGTDEIGSYFSFTCENGFQQDLSKAFYFYIRGDGAGFLPEASASPVRGLNDPPNQPSDYSPTVIQPFTPARDANGNWTVKIEGRFTPQPDRLTFSFTVYGASTSSNDTRLTEWWFGENCIPTPGSMGLLGLGVAFASVRPRRGLARSRE